ncbi:MAG: helix-turn-helix domain-containing protein [Phycisphaerales bacterium]
MTAVPGLRLVRDAAAAASLLDPTRQRLLRELARPEGDSAAGLSRRVGMKRQLVNYHLRELEKAGLVELVAKRRRGSVSERLVRASATMYAIDPGVLGELAADPRAVPDRSSPEHLVALASEMIEDVAALSAQSPAGDAGTGTQAMRSRVRFATSADRAAFFEDLVNEIAKLISEYHDQSAPGGRWSTLVVGAHVQGE